MFPPDVLGAEGAAKSKRQQECPLFFPVDCANGYCCPLPQTCAIEDGDSICKLGILRIPAFDNRDAGADATPTTSTRAAPITRTTASTTTSSVSTPTSSRTTSSILTTSTPTTLSTASTTAAQPSTLASEPAVSGTGSTSLSPAAGAGIAVGAVVLALLAVGLLFCKLRRRHRPGRPPSSMLEQSLTYSGGGGGWPDAPIGESEVRQRGFSFDATPLAAAVHQQQQQHAQARSSTTWSARDSQYAPWSPVGPGGGGGLGGGPRRAATHQSTATRETLQSGVPIWGAGWRAWDRDSVVPQRYELDGNQISANERRLSSEKIPVPPMPLRIGSQKMGSDEKMAAPPLALPRVRESVRRTGGVSGLAVA